MEEKLSLYERNLIRKAERLEDQIIFKKISEDDLYKIINELLQVNLLSLNYETREVILYVFCEAVENYDIREKINWTPLLDIKPFLEKDLQEYTEELFL